MQKRIGLFVIAAACAAGCNQGGAPGEGAAPESQRKSGAAARDARPVATQPAPPKLTLPAGTALPLVLETTLSSVTSNQGDAVVAKLAEDVKLGEKVVAPAGSEVRGRVTAAVRSGKVKGLARLAFEFDSLVVKGRTVAIATTPIDITAQNTKKKDAAIIGGATAGGAIIGAIIDGGKGAAIGAGVGAAGGTGTVLATRGKEVELAAGRSLSVKLTEAATL